MSVNKTVLILGSMTYSIKAKKILLKNNLSCEIIKINFSAKSTGCSYGIKINSDEFYDVAMRLNLEGIEYTVYSF